MLRRSFSKYTIEKKSSSTLEYQPDELDDDLIEKNHEECPYPQNIKLIISRETMRYEKVRPILRYHVANKLLSPDQFARHVILLSFPFRDGKQLQ